MTTMNDDRPKLGKNITLILVGIGLAAMFFGSMLYRMDNPELTKAMRQPTQDAGHGDEAAGMGGMDMKQVRAMMEGLEKRLEDEPTDLEALLQLANLRTMRGDREAAVEYLIRAEENIGEDKDTLMNLAGRWFELEEYSHAAAALEKIISFEPTEMFAHYNLGVLYKYRMGRSEDGDRHLRIVAEGEHDRADLRESALKALEE